MIVLHSFHCCFLGRLTPPGGDLSFVVVENKYSYVDYEDLLELIIKQDRFMVSSENSFTGFIIPSEVCSEPIKLQ